MKKRKTDFINSTRFVDSEGRIFIPFELRNQLKINEGDGYNFFVDKTTQNLILKPIRKLSKEEKINEWVEEISREISTSFRQIDFITNRNVVVCICSADESGVIPNDLNEIEVGIAICSSKDKFNLKIGRCISYCRAIGEKIPDFMLEK